MASTYSTLHSFHFPTIVSLLKNRPSYLSMAESTSSLNNLKYRDVYRAAETGKEVEVVRTFYRERPTSTINDQGDTVLHILIQNNHTRAASDLLKLPIHGLSAKNCKGNTVLHEAAKVGDLEIAELIIQKKESLISERNLIGETPLYWAAAYGQTKLFQYLAATNISGDHHGLERNDGCTVLHAAVMGEFYGLALQIMDLYPNLALAPNGNGNTALRILGETLSSFKSGTSYSQINILKAPFIPLALLSLVIYFCIPSDADMDPQETKNGQSSLLLGNRIKGFPYLRKIDDAKQKHKLALELAEHLIIRELEHLEPNPGPLYDKTNISATPNTINDILMLAARHGIVELIDVILKECPWSIEFLDKDGKNILHLAAEYRQVGVFKLLTSEGFLTTKMIADVDNMKNTALHLAAEYADHVQEKNVDLSSRNMWQEMFWFKQVKDVSLDHLFHLRNDKGKTADELFNETHMSLLKKSVQNVKEDSENAILISTLIASINFTAAFAVPGGYNEDSGLPTFSSMTRYFPAFYAYSSVALFFSLVAVTGCICSYLARFHWNDFYIMLPIKFLVVGNSVVFSGIYTMLAFIQALILVTNAEFRVIEFALGVLAVIVAMAVVILIYVDIMFPIFCYIVDVLLHSISYQDKIDVRFT